MHPAGDSEETQVALIFTRIASFDNPSKDVNDPFELVRHEKHTLFLSHPEGRKNTRLKGPEISFMHF